MMIRKENNSFLCWSLCVFCIYLLLFFFPLWFSLVILSSIDSNFYLRFTSPPTFLLLFLNSLLCPFFFSVFDYYYSLTFIFCFVLKCTVFIFAKFSLLQHSIMNHPVRIILLTAIIVCDTSLLTISLQHYIVQHSFYSYSFSFYLILF